MQAKKQCLIDRPTAVPLKHVRATSERIEKFISDIYFTDVNLYGRVDKRIEGGVKIFTAPGLQTDSITDVIAFSKWTPATGGTPFTPLWSQHWVKVEVDHVNVEDENLELLLHWDVSGAESLVYVNSDIPKQGLSDKRKEVCVKGGDKLYIQVSCTGLFGAGKNGMINPPDENRTFSLSACHLVKRDKIKYSVYMDLCVLYDITKECKDHDTLKYDAMLLGNEIINLITKENHSLQSYHQAKELVNKLWRSDDGKCGSKDMIHAIGHCHIDSAWLWPWRETVRKVARSWSTTLSLMDNAHDFHFACSQVCQYDWLKNYYPKLYKKMRSFIKAGKFVPVGGSWVEMDTNIPSGESLIRQFLYGQKFYREEFGVFSNILWLPDTFGYSAQLPQIMKQCGVDYFLSQKLSWNLTNTFPHNTFYWKGIDGSKVLAHFPPGDTYESHIDVKDILKSANNNKDKGRTHDHMLLFGYGDGGGGPTADMLERLDRLQHVQGLPNIVRSTPTEFFNVLEKELLCEWWGELYFELHRGTYTTHAKLKENNRRCESLLTKLEFVYSLTNESVGMVTENIEKLWKIVLFNQFHDIIPGSSIEQVFKDAMSDYDKFYELYKVTWDLLTGGAEPVRDQVVINPFHWTRTEVIKVRDNDAESYQLVSVPPLSCQVPGVVEPVDKAGIFVLDNGNTCMCNSIIKSVFDPKGRMISFLHKPSKRECIPAGQYGNQFVIFDDIPLFWDAWDVMEYHVETRKEYEPSGIKVVEETPLRCVLQIELSLGDHGSGTVDVILDANLPYLKFSAEVKWLGIHKFLKVEFPLTVMAMEAEYDIQSGFVKRPTHANTSWDSARFEVSGHKWAHLGEPGFGVGVMTRSKYGYSAQSNRLTVSLLRSTTAPDGNADIGSHVIEYALYPHAGPLYSSKLVQHATNYNSPLRLVAAPKTPPTACPPLNIKTEGGEDEVVIQSIKRAESGEGVVVRLYEPYGNTVVLNMNVAEGNKHVHRVNAVEEVMYDLTGTNTITVKPFEIVSLLVK